jgi:hypothetical protein
MTRPIAGLQFVGDSNMSGRGDAPVNGGNAYLGWNARGAVAAGIGWTRTSLSGQTWSDFLTPERQVRRMYASEGATHVLCNYSTNDITGGATLSDLQSRATTVAAMVHECGLKFVLCTIFPRTDAANSGGFYGSDTATQVQLVRDYNAWVRTRPFGDTIFDLSKYAVDPAAIDRWRSDLGTPTTDGLHPAPVIHAACASGFAADLPTILA